MELSQTLGQLNKNTTLIGGEVIYTANQEGNASVTGKFETASYTISLKNNESEPIPTNITVNTTSLNLTVDDIDFINATLNPSEAGNLTVSYDESIINVTQSTDGTWIVTPIAEGNTNITFSFSGSEGYAPAENKTVTVTVSKIPTNITIANATINLNVNDNVSSGATLTPADAGNLTYTSSNKSVAIVEKGKIKAIGEGNATITVSFAGNDQYNPAENKTIEVTVSLKDASVGVYEDSIDLVIGEEYDLASDVYTDPEGLNVTYVPDDSGVYSVDENGLITALKEGTGTVTVIVGGDGVYAENSTTITVTVSEKPSPKENLTISASADPITAGDNATVVVTGLENATGDVSIIANGKTYTAPIKDGEASVTVPGLTETVTAEVSYPGDDNYNNASTTVDITVNPAPEPGKDNLTIKASAEPITAGEDATIIVTGLENATGDISVITNGKTYTAPITNGKATVTVPGLTENVTATVNYAGDDTYNPATTTVNITVNPAPEPSKKNLTIKASANPITAGEDATVKVTGLEDATGDVTVTANGKTYTAPIKDGEASVTVPGLTETTTAEVSYPGDDNYNNASTTVDITVNPAPEPGKDNLTISASAEPITAGDNATVIVTGLENATGDVSVIANGKTYTAPIKDGEASVTVPGLTENATAIVNYNGDDTYNPASTTVNITVNPKGKENATISIDAPAEANEGDNVTVTVTLPEDATGSVTIGNEVVPVENGTASAVLTNLPAGNNTIPITYSGDDKYNPIETGVNISVNEDKTVVVNAPDVTKYYGGSERFVVNVTNSLGKPLVNKTVKININGRNYTRTTDENGTASMAIGLPSNSYNVTITVDNQTVNSVVTVLSTVNGTDVVKMYRNGTQYYATFLDTEGNYLTDGTAVKFNINGVMYERKVSGDKGLARLNINLPDGEYIVTAMNPETGENAANNITVFATLVENNDITKYYKNATQYTVKVLGADGNPVGAGENVTFNINGLKYTRTTNESGIAKLNINLAPGDYVITAEYNGYKVANNITVLPVLTAEDITMKYRDGTKFVATLVDGQGKAYVGQGVQFNVNGVLYTRYTDSAGQAKLNINLLAGEYIITSSYNGANIANKITIRS